MILIKHLLLGQSLKEKEEADTRDIFLKQMHLFNNTLTCMF